MSNKLGVEKEFLYRDENVKYFFDINGDDLHLTCHHPIFKSRFKSDSVTIKINEFLNASQKGSKDYDFFEKLTISLQEYLLDRGVKE